MVARAVAVGALEDLSVQGQAMKTALAVLTAAFVRFCQKSHCLGFCVELADPIRYSTQIVLVPYQHFAHSSLDSHRCLVNHYSRVVVDVLEPDAERQGGVFEREGPSAYAPH